MIYPTNKIKKQIEISNVDFNDKFFKISKKINDEILKKSIKVNGLINYPILFVNKHNNNYKILFGFNRLLILKDMGVNSIKAFIIEKISYEDYFEHVLIKNYNKEIGPIGKLKVIRILDEFFNCDLKKIISLTKNSLNIPQEIINRDLIKKVFDLPENLLNYIDYKDINYKIILKLINIPKEIIDNLSSYIDNINFKVNIFRKSLDILHDLIKEKKFNVKLADFDWKCPDDVNISREDFLLSKFQEIRYPEYTKDMKQVDEIITLFRKNKIEINFPKFFEDDKIVLKINIKKNENIEDAIKKINDIDRKSIKRLFEFL